MYSVLSYEDLEIILTNFQTGGLINFQKLQGGSANTNYRVKTQNGSYILTVCESKSIEESRVLAKVLEHLERNNFITSRIIRTRTNELYCTWNSKPVLLKSYLEGKIMEDIPNFYFISLGLQLSHLHTIPVPDYIPLRLPYGHHRFNELKNYEPGASFYRWLSKIEIEIRKTIKSKDVKWSLIHGDVFHNNVIISESEKEAVIMDFEECCYYPRIFDLGMFIIGTCCPDYKPDLDKIEVFLNNYNKNLPLSNLEIKLLSLFSAYAAASTAFWRYTQFNINHPTEHLKNSYRKMQDLANIMSGFQSKFDQILSA